MLTIKFTTHNMMLLTAIVIITVCASPLVNVVQNYQNNIITPHLQQLQAIN